MTSAITSALALVAICAAIVSILITEHNSSVRITQIQTARRAQAESDCSILRTIVERSAAQAKTNPAVAQEFLRSVGLGSCYAYSLKVISGKWQLNP